MCQLCIIESAKELRFENVASFRKKIFQSNVKDELSRFISTLKQTGAQKNGPLISATFGVEQTTEHPLIDIEFLIPLDRAIQLTDDYVFKPIFHLTNAVYSRYSGDPALIQNQYNEMIKYLHIHNLQQITVAYNVNINDGNLVEHAYPVVDIYIGANPNKL